MTMLKEGYKYSYTICMLLLFVSSFMKIYRNSYGYESSQQGGIWNINTLIFIGLALYFKLRTRVNIPIVIKTAFLYAFVSIFNCLIMLSDTSLWGIYSIIMIVFYPCTVLVFYYIGRFGHVGKIDKAITNIGFMAISLVAFLSLMSFRTLEMDFVMVSNAYYPLCLLPLVVAINKDDKKWIFLSLVLTFVVILFSTKRTGSIALILFILSMYFLKPGSLNSKILVSNIVKLSLVTIILLGLYNYFSESFDLNIMERLMNISEDKGSGRSEMYDVVFRSIMNSDIISFIFGHGMHTVGQVLPKSYDAAHNDFLQVFFEYGFLPFLLLVIHYVYLITTSLRMRKSNYEHSGLMIGGVAISLFMSLFSMYCIDFSYVICGAAFTGFFIGDWKKKLNLKY